MSEKITTGMGTLNYDDIVNWAFISLISQKSSEFAPKDRKAPINEFEIEVKINGIEVSFSELCKRLGDDFDRQVKKAALNLLKTKIGNTMDALYRIEREVINVARDEFGIEWDD